MRSNDEQRADEHFGAQVAPPQRRNAADGGGVGRLAAGGREAVAYARVALTAKRGDHLRNDCCGAKRK